MKTPEECLWEQLGGMSVKIPKVLESKVRHAMKEYAKQWIDRSVEIADMNIDATEIHSRISTLSKKIDEQ